jgi:V8-like Glu-specific endopeptidase
MIAGGGNSGIRRSDGTSVPDNRIVVDRLHSENNAYGEDDSFLNAVGAVWSDDIRRTGAGYDGATGYDAATGFLIDPCHVLTNMHAVYTERTVIDPPIGKWVAFGVGQTEHDNDRGALQGLRLLLHGSVIAHGDTVIVEHQVRNPEKDWALIRLEANVDGSISPLTITAVDLALLPRHLTLSAAGFPTDHRRLRRDGFKLKDLWGSAGRIVGLVSFGGNGALVQTTIQTTPGSSGGPIYGDFNGRKHIVVGMVQSIPGNGIDVSEDAPNIQVLFTPGAMTQITEAEAETPCG